jgi:peptide/nickel transport system substrate-binding protein
MENRFGIKDLFLFLLIAGLIVVVVMAMYQFDRQYQEVLTIKQQNNDLTTDIAKIRRQLAEGVQAVALTGPLAGGGTGSSTQPTTQKVDTFTHLRAAEKMPGFATGDWLIDNFATKIGKLTPFTSSDIYQQWIEGQVMEGLCATDPYSLEQVPRLATRWDISPDGLTQRYYLRRGVEFSDGAPLNADDVIFTFDWMRNPAVNADRARSYFTDLKDVKKIDDYTVEFTFNKYYFLSFQQVTSTSIMPRHFYSKYTPDQFNEATGLLMGSGPYKLENPTGWTPTGQGVTLVRNERYWGEPATFDRLVFKEVEGEATEMVMYGNQEIDLIRCTPEQYNKLKSDQRVMSFSNNFEYDYMYGGYVYCGWNQVRIQDGKESKTFFADKRVRQAMTMLLDRDQMCREIFLGYATPATGPFSPNSPQYDHSVKAWPHDEAAAKALLEQAGFKDRNGDGIIDGPDGQPFKFKITYPSGSETWEKVVLSMKDSYARAGIIAEPERVDWPVLVQKLNTSNFDAVTLGWSSVPEDDPYQIFHSDSIKGQGDNRTHYINPELDRLIEKARGTVDKEQRMQLWHQIHRVLHEDEPYTFLFDRKALKLIAKRIHNVSTSTIGLNFEYLNGGVMPWFVPKNEQRYTK